MKAVVVETVPEQLRVNLGAPCARMLEFFNDKRSGAFADDEAVTQFVKRPASLFGIFATAHRLNDIERTNGYPRQRSFRPAGDNDIDETIANVAERLTNRDGAAGAAI